ncbi:hypothetical protein [Arthrobacter agilis]|uniref:hypothetical protein n=1 Tax=Arthrobacter agilis TaxID=37921 RepID=UPI002785D623|nr:hypothetical protein [Arthrobacter agilis]MDQ0734748.1 hypothetical protein [Arthrobacter agilis]
MPKHRPEKQREGTLQAMHASGLDVQSVWIRYFSLSGNADEFEVDAYLSGLITLSPLDRDLVSHAVNELITEAAPPTAPYSNDPQVSIAQKVLDILDPSDGRNERNEDGRGQGQ